MEPDELLTLPGQPTGDVPIITDLGDFFRIGNGPNAQIVPKTPDTTDLIGARRALLDSQATSLAGKAEDVQRSAEIENNRFLARGLASALSKGMAGRRNNDLSDRQSQTDRIVSGLLQDRNVTRRAAKDAAVSARVQGELLAAQAELEGAQQELESRAKAFNAFNAEENKDRRAAEDQERRIEVVQTEGEIRQDLQTLDALQKELRIPGFNPSDPAHVALVQRSLGTDANPLSQEDAVSLINAAKQDDEREQEQEIDQISARTRTSANTAISSANAIKLEESRLLVGAAADEIGRVAQDVASMVATPSDDEDFRPITTLSNISDLSKAYEAARQEVAIATRSGDVPSEESFILSSFPPESVRAGSNSLNALHNGRLVGLAFARNNISEAEYESIRSSLSGEEQKRFDDGIREIAQAQADYRAKFFDE